MYTGVTKEVVVITGTAGQDVRPLLEMVRNGAIQQKDEVRILDTYHAARMRNVTNVGNALDRALFEVNMFLIS